MGAAARSDIALGATVNLNGDPSSLVPAFSASVGGNTPALWSISSKWGQDSTKHFPTQKAEDLHAMGVTPLIWWTPTNPADWEAGRYERYQRILNGKHDKYIKNWAKAAADFGHLVVVRFAHEANGNWFPWSISRFDNSARNFKQAWRYVRNMVRDQGATNVKFLWSVAKQSCRGCNPYMRVFPGRTNVDYVGFTAFNWGTFGNNSWQSLVRTYQQPMNKLAFTKKPVIAAETASHYKGGDKAKWIRLGYKKAYAKWPRLKAIVYLDSNPKNTWFRHPNWELSMPKDGSALAAYAAIAGKPEFQGSLP